MRAVCGRVEKFHLVFGVHRDGDDFLDVKPQRHPKPVPIVLEQLRARDRRREIFCVAIVSCIIATASFAPTCGTNTVPTE